MAQDRWWIHQRGKSLYSTQNTSQKNVYGKDLQKNVNIWWYMMIYVNICQYGSRLDYNKFHSTAWKCIICSNPCTGTIWNIKEPLTPSSNSPFWGEGRWLYGRHLEGGRIRKPRFQLVQRPMPVPPQCLQPSHLPTNRLPICPDLPRFACCYTIICITSPWHTADTNSIKQSQNWEETHPPLLSRTTRSLMKHSCNLSKARTLAVEHAIPGRQGSGQKTATGKKVRINEHQNIWIHLTVLTESRCQQ